MAPLKNSNSNLKNVNNQQTSTTPGTSNNLTINIDTICALTGLTNGDLINLIENDF